MNSVVLIGRLTQIRKSDTLLNTDGGSDIYDSRY